MPAVPALAAAALATVGACLGALALPAAEPVVPGRLAFASERAHGTDLDVWIAWGDGSAPRKLTALRTDEFSPSWSPDGARIAYRVNPPRSDVGDIWVMDADGSGKRNLTRTPRTAEWSPAWSPDGTAIAYFSNAAGGDVWVMRPDGTARRNLTGGASSLSEYPTWSPDGTRIAFNDHRTGNFEIFAMNADGSRQVNLTNDPASDEWPSWSPDGSRIAFRSMRDGNAEIYTVSPDGSGQVNVTRSRGYEDFPAWTPDGRIGFVCDEGLCVVNADGTERRSLGVEGGFPAWTPTAAGPARPAGELSPSEAIAGLIDAWEGRPLVAWAEEHGSVPEHTFLRTLVRDPSFAEAVDDIVVEFGNARHQQLVDRYVAGAKVSLGEVQKAWLQTSQGRVWSQPVYGQFFSTVRAVNRALPAAKRLRIVLGDPPYDAERARRSRAYHERVIGQRGAHYAGVVERQALAKGRRALVIAGAFHLLRRPGRDHETGMLEARHPGSVFVVLPFIGFSGYTDRWAEAARRLAAAAPGPWLAPLAGTWLGELPASAFFVEGGWSEGSIAGRADALLRLGAS